MLAGKERKSPPIHETMKQRWSPKGFLDIPVEPEKLRSMLEAARWAPSSRNDQPWRFIVESKSNKAGYQRIFGTLSESNRGWAGQAPVLVAVIAKSHFDRDGSENPHSLYDTGGAVANMTSQAVSVGLQVHQMGGFDPVRLREEYRIPAEFEPVTVLAVGYADEKLRGVRRRVRNDLRALVFEKTWEHVSDLVS